MSDNTHPSNDKQLTLTPPTKRQGIMEFRAVFDWLKACFYLPLVSAVDQLSDRPIILIPGYLADEWSLSPLKKYLVKIGYPDTSFWDIGRNMGDVDTHVEQLSVQLNRIGKPVTLIGWSLGGVIARETARIYPSYVHSIITLGTPVTGGPKYTAAAQKFAKAKNINLDEFEYEVLQRNKIGIEQPVTVIFSKSDGVVSWPAAIDVYNDQAINIEVPGSHFGLGVSTVVWKVIASTLKKLNLTEIK